MTLALGALYVFAGSDEVVAGPPKTESVAVEIQTAALAPGLVPIERLADLPRVLSGGDVIRYRRIFELQEGADWTAADALIAELDSDILLGHVSHQRYMHATGYRSTYVELAGWLADYADLPGAWRVYRLAMSRRPKGADAPRTPPRGYLRGVGEDQIVFSTPKPRRELLRTQDSLVKAGRDEIRELIREGRPTEASRVLVSEKLKELLSEAQYDALQAEIGRSFFVNGRDKQALEFAGASARRSGDVLPGSHWTSGLAAWRLGDLTLARKHFGALAESVRADDYLVAGGAYWSARVHGLTRQPLLANRMLRIAAEFPRNLYGVLARRALGEKPEFDWDPAGFAQAETDLLLNSTRARRAMALAEIGQRSMAEEEIRKLYPNAGERTGRALLKLAEHLDLPALQIRIGSKQARIDGRRHDRALYPVPDWTPDPGLEVDRAILFAVIRQESVFNPKAKSHRGARGLMQLMPMTASFIDGETRYHNGKADHLFAPELNLSLGQKYVRHLLDTEGIDGNILYMLAAYNAGPGNLSNWLKSIDDRDDPLLFIEAVPLLETRRYIRRVLTNLWIYRDRLDQSAESLTALAAGRWPIYASQDEAQVVADIDGY